MHNHLWGEDHDGAKLIALMDEASVERTLILGLDLFDSHGKNADVMRLRARYPDRIVAGVMLDPRDGKAIDKMKAYRADGASIVKLFPNDGYYPDDEQFLPFFETVAELGMGVLSHCGWLMPAEGKAFASYYSQPGRFEKVIRRFTETPFIMAHMGGIDGFLQTVMLCTRTPNTYTDPSPGQGMLVLKMAGKIASAIPAEKIVYGPDGYSGVAQMENYAAIFTDLGYSEQDLAKIFYSNGRGILEKIGALQAG
jgi:predicted TIM-barrel fold metal-dependent hydrolase